MPTPKDRRREARVIIDRPVDLRCADGTRVSTVVHDLSPAGLGIWCDATTAYTIHPEGHYLSAENAPEVDVALVLPVESGDHLTLEARCRLVAVVATPGEHEALLRLEFSAPDPGRDAHIERLTAAVLDRSRHGDAPGEIPHLQPDRRRYPRIPIDCAVHVYAPGGNAFARARDLSPDGLQIVCDAAAAERINPDGRYQAGEEPAPVRVEFPLGLGEGTEIVVHARCRLVYHALENRHDFLFGLTFLEVQGEGARHLERFIARCLVPADWVNPG